MFLLNSKGIIKMKKRETEIKSIIFGSQDIHISQRKTFKPLKSSNIETSTNIDYYNIPFERLNVSFDDSVDKMVFDSSTNSYLQSLYSGKNVEISFTLKSSNTATPKIGFSRLNQYNSRLLRLEVFDFYLYISNRSIYYTSLIKNVSNTLLTTLVDGIDHAIRIILEEENIYIYDNNEIILTITEALIGYYKPAILRDVPTVTGNNLGADILNNFRVIYYAPYPVGIDPFNKNISTSFSTDHSLDYSSDDDIKKYNFDFNRNKQSGLTNSLIGNNLYVPKFSDINSLDSLESNNYLDISKKLDDIYAFIPFHHSGCINASVDSTNFPDINGATGLASEGTEVFAYDLYKSSILVTTIADIDKNVNYSKIECLFRLDITQDIEKRQPYSTKDLKLRIFQYNSTTENNNSDLLYTESINDYDILTFLTIPSATKRLYNVLKNGELIFSIDTDLEDPKSYRKYGCFFRADYSLSFSNITESPLFSFSTNITKSFNIDKKYNLLEDRTDVYKLSKISESSGLYYDKLYFTSPYKTNIVTFLADTSQNNYIVYGPYAPKKDIVYDNNQFITYENGSRNGNLLLKFSGTSIYIYKKDINGNTILTNTLINKIKNNDRITLFSNVDISGIIYVNILVNDKSIYIVQNNISINAKIHLTEASRTQSTSYVRINYNVQDLTAGDTINLNFLSPIRLDPLSFLNKQHFKTKEMKNNMGDWYYNAIYTLTSSDVTSYPTSRYIDFNRQLYPKFSDASQIKITSCYKDALFIIAAYTDTAGSSIRELQTLDPAGISLDKYLWSDETIIAENKTGALIATSNNLNDQFPDYLPINNETNEQGYTLKRIMNNEYEYYYAYGSGKSEEYTTDLNPLTFNLSLNSGYGQAWNLNGIGSNFFSAFGRIEADVDWEHFNVDTLNLGSVGSGVDITDRASTFGPMFEYQPYQFIISDVTSTTCKLTIYNLNTGTAKLISVTFRGVTIHTLDSVKVTPTYLSLSYTNIEKLDYSVLYKDNKCDCILGLTPSIADNSLTFNNTFGLLRTNTTSPFTTPVYKLSNIRFFYDNVNGKQTLKSQVAEGFSNIRYIRNIMNGNTINPYNHWVEVQVFNENNINIMTGLPANNIKTSINVTNAEKLIINDGVITSDPYLDLGGGEQFVEIDLGSEKSVSRINLRHYFAGTGRAYNQKLQVSSDYKIWKTIFDSDKEGTYIETASGKDFVNLFLAPGDRYGLEVERIYYIIYNSKEVRVKKGIKNKYVKINDTKYFSSNGSTIMIDSTSYSINNTYQIKKYILNENNRVYYGSTTTNSTTFRPWSIIKNVYSNIITDQSRHTDSKIYDPQIKVDYTEV